MAAIIEVKFYNSFLLRKTVINREAPSKPEALWNGSMGVPKDIPGAFPIYTTVVDPNGNEVNVSKSWVIEESRIQGGFNNTEMLYGVKAYIVDEEPNASFRTSSLIYSGIFNSRTGVNDTNVFSVGEDITKSLDPSLGSIQKLYAEDTNLIIFQENKVNRALIDKDAIYTAEGGGTPVSQLNLVIGQIVPYAGNYGISKDPRSFAVYGYRKYFTDRDRNAVLRLSQDGITEISNYGMIDYFRDQFGNLDTPTQKGVIVGGWDIHTKQYVISLQKPNGDYQTLSFDEQVLGWPSRFTYNPDQAFSLDNKFYTIRTGRIYEHNYESSSNNNRGYFYGQYSPSNITFIFNPNASASKVFKTVNYEGSTGWKITSFNSSRSFEVNDIAAPITSYDEGSYVDNNITYYSGFYKKEGKYFANIVNDSQPTEGEVVFGNSISGVKGYYSTVTIETDASTRQGLGGVPRELFAVSSEYVESSY